MSAADPTSLTTLLEPGRDSSSRRCSAFAIVLVLVHSIVSLTFHHSYGLTIFGDTAQSALIGFAMIATARNAGRTRGTTRTFWTLMTAGCALWLGTQLLWMLYEVGLRREVPDLFVRDIVLFLHVVPFMAALALQPHIRRMHHETALGMIDLALLVLWWLYLYLLLVIPWQLIQIDRAVYGVNFDLVYSAENFVFAAAVGFVALRSRRLWRPFYWHLFGAAVLYAGGALSIGAAIDSRHYYTGSIYDLPLIASSAWLGCAALSARWLQPDRVQADSVPSRVLLWPGRLAMLAVLSIPGVAWWVLIRDAVPSPVFHFRLVLTLGAVFLLAAIVFYKEHLLDRELIRLVMQANDALANLVRVQNQLIQSEKLAAIGQMVAGAAHEINNPLAAIIGYCDLLSGAGAEAATIAGKIGKQARRTKALVHNLLHFARESAADKKSTNLNAIVAAAIRLQQSLLIDSRIAVELNTAHSAPLVMADANQMLQVILHVVGNAIDALQEVGGGVLKLTTRVIGDTVSLEVTDTGPGIREPNKVFDPFYTTKPVGQGTGLGLSMAYGIINKHGGKISGWNNPGGGATFRITLPVVARS